MHIKTRRLYFLTFMNCVPLVSKNQISHRIYFKIKDVNGGLWVILNFNNDCFDYFLEWLSFIKKDPNWLKCLTFFRLMTKLAHDPLNERNKNQQRLFLLLPLDESFFAAPSMMMRGGGALCIGMDFMWEFPDNHSLKSDVQSKECVVQTNCLPLFVSKNVHVKVFSKHSGCGGP